MSLLVGRQAPDFTTAGVLGTGEIVNTLKFSELTKGKYSLVFFYPLDFTFVCPSELIALDHRMDDFVASKFSVSRSIHSLLITHGVILRLPKVVSVQYVIPC